MSQKVTKIKICGLRTPSDIAAVNAVLPEYCGFIFAPGRRRYVTPEDAEVLRRQLDPRIRPVGVFVNAGTSSILEVLSVCHLDMVQLHGQETNGDIDALRSAVRVHSDRIPDSASDPTPECPPGNISGRAPDNASGCVPDDESGRMSGQTTRPFQIIKAYRIDAAPDMETAAASHADFILLDHGAGGTGEAFDWSLIRDCGRPFILAGGLGPDNVAEAIARTHPYAVDASSSLETDGHKDPEKVRRFAAAVRSAADRT